MALAPFDTLKFANTLKAAGVPPAQAEAQAVAFAEVMQVSLKELATKDDLAALGKELRQEIATQGKELRQEIAASAQRMDSRFDVVLAEMKAQRAEVRGEIILLKWMFGVGVTVGLGVLVRLFLIGGLT